MAVDTGRKSAPGMFLAQIKLPNRANSAPASTDPTAFVDAYIAVSVDAILTGPSVLDAAATQAFRDAMEHGPVPESVPPLPLDAF